MSLLTRYGFSPQFLRATVVTVLLVAIFLGSMYFLILLTELISRFGLGHGISIIILSGICANFIHGLEPKLSILYETGSLFHPLLMVIFGLMAAGAVVLLRTRITIPVKRAGSEKFMNIFQFNLCPSGDVAVSYATSLIMLPVTIGSFFEADYRFLDGFQPGRWNYSIVVVIFIFVFSYLFVRIFLHPQRRIARMMDRGWQFSDSDNDIKKYLLRKVFIYNLPWTLYLCALAIIPSILITSADIPFYVGGASLYIVVAISMDVIDRYRFDRKTQSGELAKIAEFHDIYDAAMIKKHMDSEGTRSHLQGYYHRQLYYFFGPYIDISLMVAKKDVEFCEDLLLKYHDGLGVIRARAADSG